MTTRPPLQAPFPWFGGKSRVAAAVWERLGDCPNYVEPFAGSLAVLLGRPTRHRGGTETVNDSDGYIANFWRAITADPAAVAHWADWPVSEVDLHARNAWLTTRRSDFTAHLMGDPDWYDAKIAGWWVWGVCATIGDGWCAGAGPWTVADGRLVLGATGQGITRSLPHLSDRGQGINRAQVDVPGWFTRLAARTRGVRICCGDWTRVVTDTVTTNLGRTALFLDPPSGVEDRTRVYADDSATLAADVREWCLTHGGAPGLRIALCGYTGEGHDVLTEQGWTAHAWRPRGGYGVGRGGRGDANRDRERIWFSPACEADTRSPLFEVSEMA